MLLALASRLHALMLRGQSSVERVAAWHMGLESRCDQGLLFDSHYPSGQQGYDVSLSCLIAHKLPAF